MNKKIVIMGGVAGGATAAAKARRNDEKAEITVYERGPYVSFANCGLPYFVGGEIKDRDDLLLMTPESFWNKYRVRVHIQHEVTRIDRQNKQILGVGPNGESFKNTYDVLILSPGAQPIMPPLPGIDKPHVMNLRSIPDMDRIHTFINEHNPKTAVVVGGGFIGLEMAEAFCSRGLAVTVVELMPQILPPLDHDMAAFFTSEIKRPGLEIITGVSVTEIQDKMVVLSDQSKISADLVLVSAGVKPEVTLGRNAGLAVGKTGGLIVNDRMQTSDAAIYVVGDAAEIKHRITDLPVRIPLAGPANRQGRIAAINATGGNATYNGALGTSIVRVFDSVIGMTGLSARAAEEAGIKAFNSVTLDNDHAGYYPGARMIRTKIVYRTDTGKLLGAQVMGEHGVDKRLDVLATALSAGMTVEDLAELDLSYAPPFGTANDPVNTAGFVASHIVRGEVVDVQHPEQMPEGAQLVDVRNPGEIKKSGMLKGAKNIPLPELRERFTELDAHRPVVVYCAKGLRGYLALRILKGHGFANVSNINGGFPRAVVQGWPVTK